jgi:hypothetical protein
MWARGGGEVWPQFSLAARSDPKTRAFEFGADLRHLDDADMTANLKLTHLRNILLPRLISGQLRPPPAEVLAG